MARKLGAAVHDAPNSPRWMPTVVQPSNLFPIDPNLGPPTTEMSAAFVDHKSVPAAQPYRGAAAGRPSTAQEQAAAHPDVRMELSTLMQRVSALQQQLGDAAGEEHQGVLSEIAAKPESWQRQEATVQHIPQREGRLTYSFKH